MYPLLGIPMPPSISVTLRHAVVDLVYGSCTAIPDTGADASIMGTICLNRWA